MSRGVEQPSEVDPNRWMVRATGLWGGSAVLTVLLAGGLYLGLGDAGWFRPASLSANNTAAPAQLEPPSPVTSERALPQVGDTFRDSLRSGGEGPLMVVVPSGSFMMGSPSYEEGWWGPEGPVHRVVIPRRFAVGVHEVTRGEFERFVDATSYSTGESCWAIDEDGDINRAGRSWRDPGFRQSAEHPVVCVNWNDAQAYVEWLSGQTGYEYRLPSESEWEYTARASTATPFHTGSTISTDQANYDGNYAYGSGRKGVYRGRTVPVGSFAGNSWGLHDVHGNVSEWVEDCWNDSYRGAPADGGAWASGDCGHRVARGGSWLYNPSYLRSAYREGGGSGYRGDSMGFRVARTLAP